MKRVMLSLIAGMMVCGGSQAALTVTTSASDPQATGAITGFQSSGSTMGGASVTFNGTVNETLAWGAVTSPDSFGVQGTGWRLTQEFDTYSNPWTLSVSSGTTMTSLLIDGGPGSTVFDVVSGSVGTPGSSDGLPFASPFVTALPGTWTVEYSGPVSVAPNAFQGDLYRYMLITPDVGWTGELTFMASTDHASTAVTPVPAPSALLLAGLGSGVAGFFRRRQWS